MLLSILGFWDLTGGHEVPPEEEQAQILTSCHSPGNQLTAFFSPYQAEFPSCLTPFPCFASYISGSRAA